MQYPNIITIISPIVKFGGSPRQRLIQGRTQKLMGYMRGTPDIFFPHPRNGYHGLFIELKNEGGKTSPEQREMLKNLNEKGYLAAVCFGIEAAMIVFKEYFQGQLNAN